MQCLSESLKLNSVKAIHVEIRTIILPKKRSLGLKNDKRFPSKVLRMIYRNSLSLNSYTNNFKLKSFANNSHKSFNLNSYECFYKQKFFRHEFLQMVLRLIYSNFVISLMNGLHQSVPLKILQVDYEQFTQTRLAEILTNGFTNDLEKFAIRKFLQIVLENYFFFHFKILRIFLRVSYIRL